MSTTSFSSPPEFTSLFSHSQVHDPVRATCYDTSHLASRSRWFSHTTMIGKDRIRRLNLFSHVREYDEQTSLGMNP